MAVLEEQADAAWAAEYDEVLADIGAKVVDYGFTERDIFGRRRGGCATFAGDIVPPRYRDPKTGTTWSGRGREPNWIKDVKNRNRFANS
jgi:DNA-binding protein H-NS